MAVPVRRPAPCRGDLAAGSDWSVSTPNPFAAIHVAVNRRSAPGEGLSGDAEFLPEQRLDLATALTAYTAGSARVNHHDDTGTIAVGTTRRPDPAGSRPV